MAQSFCGSDTLESSRKLFVRQLKKADREEFPRIVDSARIPNPRRNTEALVRKPRPVEVVVAEALFESSDQIEQSILPPFMARGLLLFAAAERRRPAFVYDSLQACLPSILSAWHGHPSERTAKATLEP
jgi:hypothetical protein